MAGLKFPCTVLPMLPVMLLTLREPSASLSDTMIFWLRSATPTIGYCIVALIYLFFAIVNMMAYIDCVLEFGDLFCPATDSQFVVWSHWTMDTLSVRSHAVVLLGKGFCWILACPSEFEQSNYGEGFTHASGAFGDCDSSFAQLVPSAADLNTRATVCSDHFRPTMVPQTWILILHCTPLLCIFFWIKSVGILRNIFADRLG
jgi:hypothetical protein